MAEDTIPNTVFTNLGRTLDLPVNTTDIEVGEVILSTSSPEGKLYTVKEKNGTETLHDYSLVQEDFTNYSVLCLPLTTESVVDTEETPLDFSHKLKLLENS